MGGNRASGNTYMTAVSDANGIATFALGAGDLPASFVACADPNGDGVETEIVVTSATVPAGDPIKDVDGTIAEPLFPAV